MMAKGIAKVTNDCFHYPIERTADVLLVDKEGGRPLMLFAVRRVSLWKAVV